MQHILSNIVSIVGFRRLWLDTSMRRIFSNWKCLLGWEILKKIVLGTFSWFSLTNATSSLTFRAERRFSVWQLMGWVCFSWIWNSCGGVGLGCVPGSRDGCYFVCLFGDDVFGVMRENGPVLKKINFLYFFFFGLRRNNGLYACFYP